jgi:hypothetical protein
MGCEARATPGAVGTSPDGMGVCRTAGPTTPANGDGRHSCADATDKQNRARVIGDLFLQMDGVRRWL